MNLSLWILNYWTSDKHFGRRNKTDIHPVVFFYTLCSTGVTKAFTVMLH